jgi:hypothetical protein
MMAGTKENQLCYRRKRNSPEAPAATIEQLAPLTVTAQSGSYVHPVQQMLTAALLWLALAAQQSTAEHTPTAPDYCSSCAREPNGRIKRSRTARRAFQRSHPGPSTHLETGPCKGYVIDHIVPMYKGGLDTPANMQWQTSAEAKAKDRLE